MYLQNTFCKFKNALAFLNLIKYYLFLICIILFNIAFNIKFRYNKSS